MFADQRRVQGGRKGLEEGYKPTDRSGERGGKETQKLLRPHRSRWPPGAGVGREEESQRSGREDKGIMPWVVGGYG
ncbi:hypothetical protein CesoFtcFv8_013416 [Champsocephalus esox]|uniref:Uncharacterized protein n=1 Tax=Champsocephalus esox TaxID=159716 RepID=A0AAN8GSI3_9TELE|nr:hypothetical protein CesoFtcFv8_013416 [Champsocephalus esox]